MQQVFDSLRSTLMITTLGVAGILLSGCNKPAETTTTSVASNTAATAIGKKIRIATEGAYKPFNYTNKDGSLAGFDVEVAKAVCAQMQADCQIVAQDWEGILPGLMAKKYDAIVSAMSVTPERSVQVDFTQPYFKNTMVWLASTDGKFNPAAVKGYKLGGQRSTTLGQYLQDKLGKDNDVKLYDTYDNAYMDLKSGRINAVLSEKVSATQWLKQNQAGFGIIGQEINNNDNIAIAVRKNDPLKADFDKALTTLQQNGELAKLQQQHFGQ